MKEQAISKINKIGKISGIITTIAKVLVGIGMVLTLVGAIVCVVLPEPLFKVAVGGEMMVEMDFGSLGMSLSEDELMKAQESLNLEMNGEEPEITEVSVSSSAIMMKGDFDSFSFTMHDFARLLLLALVTLVMTFITLMFVGSLCKAFRDCQSPFEEGVIKKMQNFAYALIPWTIVATVTNSMYDSLMNHKIALNLTLDLGVVLIVLIVLVLVHIFKYGAVLQQESDETL